MDNTENFLFYNSWWDIVHEEYEDEKDRKELIYAICKFGRTGEKTFPLEKMFLKQAYTQIEIAKAKHIKRVEAGRKGGENGKGDAKRRNGNKNASKTQANDNDNVNVNAKDNDNDNVNDNNNALIGYGLLTDQAKALTTEDAEADEEYLSGAEMYRRWKIENGIC